VNFIQINIIQLLGGRIIANDGRFLGIISRDRFESESIANQFGEYGSRFKPYSIFNETGEYGSEYSPLSPFNEFSNTPPKIYVNDEFRAYLTVNSLKRPRLDPAELSNWLGQT
jgi:hypothetical protein